jgi:hypothetical protein
MRDTGRTCGTCSQAEILTAHDTQRDAHDSGDKPELAEVVAAWPDLPRPLKAAILAIVRSQRRASREGRNS